jgi:aconitate hydratase
VIAKSFARIHVANLINAGILPLTFKDASDYDVLNQGNKLRLSDIRKGMAVGQITLTDETTGKEIQLACDLTQRQMDIVIAGGLLNYTKENG